MVHHLVLFKLKPEVDDAKVEEMMRETRMRLLKIPEVRSVLCGKRIDPKNEWPFFLCTDFDSMDRLTAYMKHPIHVALVEEIIRPNTTERLALDYETDPGKDVRYS